MEPYTKTINKTRISLTNPDVDSINIEEIAYALARQCRFNGHVKGFFSVAQHCVEGTYYFDEPLMKRAILLHDGAEYILGDIITPLKRAMNGVYEQFEAPIDSVIRKKFGLESLTEKQWEDVFCVDRILLYEDMVRWRDAVPGEGTVPKGFISTLPAVQWTFDEATEKFLKAFHATF